MPGVGMRDGFKELEIFGRVMTMQFVGQAHDTGIVVQPSSDISKRGQMSLMRRGMRVASNRICTIENGLGRDRRRITCPELEPSSRRLNRLWFRERILVHDLL
ncbi:hypothetical protein PT974_10880 [Cladobotryum mycophilum]|uniref:Uncharacterized protein n=1 Tax=Cladobotryum mycophilum TaxID=491253 RepID=A0ABR0SCK7_9HYPO